MESLQFKNLSAVFVVMVLNNRLTLPRRIQYFYLPTRWFANYQ